MDPTHLASVLERRLASGGTRPAMRHRVDGRWTDISWDQLSEQVRALARGLVDAGVAEGDRVGIWSGNRPEWTIVDLAVLHVRAVSVPIYPTASASQAAYVLNDAQARLLFVGGAEPLARLAAVRGACPSLSRVVVFGGNGEGDTTPFSAVLAGGRASASGEEVERRLSRASGDDLLTLIYTSGTTGEPKGVMLTHANVASTAGGHDLRLPPIGPDDVSLCFLPLSHVFERCWTYYLLHRAVTNAYVDDPKNVAEYLREVRPTVMCAVPRFYEKVHSAILTRAASGPALRRAVFRWAVGVGAAHAERHRNGLGDGAFLGAAHALADRLVLGKLRAAVGGRIRFMPCAGAPLAREIEEFFDAVGLFILHGYGLTETTATVTCHELTGYRPGTVGKPLPGIEVRIAEDGEVLVRSATVMKGYYNKPRETAEVFRDGWFRTGDAGVLDPDGALRLTDRLKDLMKTSGGKYVAPQAVESAIAADPLVEQVVAVAEGRKYVSALVVPAFEALEGWARAEGLRFASRDELIALPSVVERYRQIVDERTRDLGAHEKVQRFTLLPTELTIEAGEITPTLKVRRKAVLARHREAVESMYREG